MQITKRNKSTHYAINGLRPVQVDAYKDGKRVLLPPFDPMPLKDVSKIIEFLQAILTHENKQ